MKKFLSFMLVLAMIASMMCINVSAATENATEDIVGDRATENGIDAGEEAGFTSKHQGSEVKVSVEGTVESRYAVELVYTSMTIVITSNATWNVESLQYQGNTSVKVDGVTHDVTANTTVKGVGTFTITNYSDQPVYVTADVDNTARQNGNEVANIRTTTTVYETTTNSDGVLVDDENAYSTIGAVEPQVNKPGTKVTAKYRADITCDDWAANFATLSGQDISVAKITFKISSSEPDQNPTEGN